MQRIKKLIKKYGPYDKNDKESKQSFERQEVVQPPEAQRKDEFYNQHCVDCDRKLVDRPMSSIKQNVNMIIPFHKCGHKLICDECYYEGFYDDWCRHGVRSEKECTYCKRCACMHGKVLSECEHDY